MAKIKGLFMDELAESEAATHTLLREAKFLSCAPRHVISHNREWIEEARELLNDALAKADPDQRDAA